MTSKNSNSLSQLTTTGGAAQDANNLEIMQLESLNYFIVKLNKIKFKIIKM